MKIKTAFAASLLVASVAFAGPTEFKCSNVIGVMPVTAADKYQVILSVPWVAEGGTNAVAVAVTNLVKTAGLTAGVLEPKKGDYVGDKLTWYDNESQKYAVWRLVSSGTTNYWLDVTTPGESGSKAVGAAEAVIKQGDALVLNRQDTNNVMYVVGQVGSSAMITNRIAGATWDAETSKWVPTLSLIAPPGALDRALDLNSTNTTSEVIKDIEYISGTPDPTTFDTTTGKTTHVGDMLISEAYNGSSAIFVYVAGNWVPSYNFTQTKSKAPKGRGFWYRRAIGSPLTIRWPAPTIDGLGD